MEEILACELCNQDYVKSESTAEHNKEMYCSKECEEDYSNSRD